MVRKLTYKKNYFEHKRPDGYMIYREIDNICVYVPTKKDTFLYPRRNALINYVERPCIVFSDIITMESANEKLEKAFSLKVDMLLTNYKYKIQTADEILEFEKIIILEKAPRGSKIGRA